MVQLIQDNNYNIGHLCTRRQIQDGHGGKVALRWISPNLERTDYTYADLEQQSNRFANLVESLGIQPGDKVFTFLPRSPELYFAFLGTLKARAIAGVLFSNFGEEALLDRLGDSNANLVLTKKSLLRKVRAIWPSLPHLKAILVVDLPEDESTQVLSYSRGMAMASADYTAAPTPPDTHSVIHYTSGSTGKPKGVQHVHRSILSQVSTFHEVLQVRQDDIFWCTADPAWVTGTSYGIIAPFSQGITQVQFAGNYDAETWFTILQSEKINVWYTAPTALRMLMREDENLYSRFDLSRLRTILSVGEPLYPAQVAWGRRVLNKDIHDTWFQTETGSIMVANRPGLPIRPGSMGKPVSGIEPAILTRENIPMPDGEQGHLCLKTGWPSMFITYLNNEAVYDNKFRGGYYDSGDIAYRDPDGYFWYVSRGDDVINTAGHLVSPYEIESVLIEMPEVAEAGVTGAPDDLLYEKVVAFVVLKPGQIWSRELELKIRLHISNRVSSIATPQDMRVVERIPKTKSGKVMRRVLKAQYMGRELGDISTMEEYNQ